MGGTVHSKRLQTDEKQVISFQRLDSYPLLVVVGFDQDYGFANYRATERRVIVIGLIVTAAVLLLGVFWISQRHRSAVSGRTLNLTLNSMGCRGSVWLA